jgi:hypothetical protein
MAPCPALWWVLIATPRLGVLLTHTAIHLLDDVLDTAIIAMPRPAVCASALAVVDLLARELPSTLFFLTVLSALARVGAASAMSEPGLRLAGGRRASVVGACCTCRTSQTSVQGRCQ